MIKQLELKNFTAFNSLSIHFSPKINIFVGENGTGKTHLLKAAYGLCAVCARLDKDSEIKPEIIEKELTYKFLRLFLPLGERLGRMRRNGVNEQAHVEASFDLDRKIAATFSARSKSFSIEENKNSEQYDARPVFIPTKEVLSLVRGIRSSKADQDTIQHIFDDTYLDLCKALLKPAGKVSADQLDVDPRFGSIFPEMVNTIGGKFEFTDKAFLFRPGVYQERKVSGQHRYSDKTVTVFKRVKGSDLSNNMTAEGFRKIGELQQLLLNRTLNPGIGGPLFWDEPESNMNPKLMKMLVRILLELARNGQQVILATHDYVLLKWLDLLLDKGKADHVCYHSLYHEPESGEVRVESKDQFALISRTTISDTFAEVYDEDVKRALGEE